MAVVDLGAWCDLVTEDEHRQRLVRDGWPTGEVENLVEDFKRGAPMYDALYAWCQSQMA